MLGGGTFPFALSSTHYHSPVLFNLSYTARTITNRTQDKPQMSLQPNKYLACDVMIGIHLELSPVYRYYVVCIEEIHIIQTT